MLALAFAIPAYILLIFIFYKQVRYINKYFSDLLTFAENKAEIKEKYQFFYEQIDEKSLESNDELFYDENYTTTDGYKTYMM